MKIYACDFETTVYEGQEDTQVWAAVFAEIMGEDTAHIFGNIKSFFEYFFGLLEFDNILLYFHNLKFDGYFILYYFLHDLKWKQAFDETTKRFVDRKDMHNKMIKYSISDIGQWYTILIKYKSHYIEIRDSYKLLPFALEKIGKDFKTRHQKLTMKYDGLRYPDCPRTAAEDEYIINDAFVLKEALEIMFAQGHTKLTIGSCCLSEFQAGYGGKHSYDYRQFFPDLSKFELVEKYQHANVDEFVRRSYKGGWCYLKPSFASKIVHNGLTADVNSLYPSVMGKELNLKYPVGNPHMWFGDYIPEQAKQNYYFVKIECRFKLKKDHLPTVQIKGNFLYDSTEWLTTSDVWNRKLKCYQEFYKDRNGQIHDTYVTFTLTCTDYELFIDHYDVFELKIISGCWFYTQDAETLFDQYIGKYQDIKIHSTGVQRNIAKLFSNNLYGKLASSQNSAFKVAYFENDILKFYAVDANEKAIGYIPIGAAITSYARNFTIRHAQENFDRFIYADTDSIHCLGSVDDLVDIQIHPTNYACWKIEAEWDRAIFVRQKTYIEHVIKEDQKSIERPYSNIKCAGMPKTCKRLLQISFGEIEISDDEKKEMYEDEQHFISIKRDYPDFDVGLCVPSKLKPKSIRGGVLLVRENFELRPKIKKGV